MNKTLITGVGALSSLGYGIHENWKNLLSDHVNQEIRRYSLGNRIVEYPIYSIPEYDWKSNLTKEQIDKVQEFNLEEDKDFVYLVTVINQAIQDANLEVKNKNVSLIVGHENLGVVPLVDQLLTTSQSKTISFSDYQNAFFHIQSFPYLFYLSSIFSIKGLTFVVNNACASGLYALDLGKKLIETKEADAVIVATSDYSHVSEYLWFQDKNFLSTSHQLKPFDQNRDGTVLGDGAAAVVLEPNDSSKLYKPYCTYTKGFFLQDGWKMTLPDVTSHGYTNVLRRAGEFLNKHIDLLIPHGTGSGMWDSYESSEISKAFSPSFPHHITTFKGYIGHTLGASSLLETVLGIKSLWEGIIPASRNTNVPDMNSKIEINTKHQKKQLKNMVKSLPAFGGFNAACIFEALD
ncbi:beta-ketoacyl synthase N-terminal-like domain-containing protein [Fictibacillus enclensis]|uniref:beta-ketoacyl synthase N-terminal-like domain-containing protein n=1 Tax=Fictibacillus enclensis TaxID=1017270 RepID=UPI0025A285BE|nr:beta-ketoacyl synthase N-terminal-like domain-containing protein [Fictibacillus enclensis]MDM5335833.1 beta-ketoacyl synthase N-terminal-like domain-containing protein [Fictibacillus enclensis]